MPVILAVAQDPTDLVLQGEEMRAAAMIGQDVPIWPIIAADNKQLPLSAQTLVAGEQIYQPMIGGYPPASCEVLRSPFGGTMVGANGQIATPCGALVDHGVGLRLMDAFVEHSGRFAVTGVTRDSTGAALGTCRVVMLETGRIATGGAPIVGETISDSSGNYSIEVPGNTAFEAIAYKEGSPDRAGGTVQRITDIVQIG